jgi:hypothetical protein
MKRVISQPSFYFFHTKPAIAVMQDTKIYGVPGEPMSDIHANNIQHSKKMNVEW